MMRYGMIAVACAAIALTAAFDSENPLRAARVTLLYVGAADCAPCRSWQRGNGARFRESDAFTRLTYREVKSPHLHDVLDDAHWASDLRGYRDRLGPNTAVPLWLVILDGAVVAEGYGETQWASTILPQIRAMTR